MDPNAKDYHSFTDDPWLLEQRAREDAAIKRGREWLQRQREKNRRGH